MKKQLLKVENFAEYGKLSRAEATNKDSSFVRMTKLETEYFVYFYYTTVRDSNGKPPGK